MLKIIEQFQKDAQALGKDSNDVNELKLWLEAEGKEDEEDEVSKWIEDAYNYYKKTHPNIIPDIDDIVEDVVNSWEEESGMDADEETYRKVKKEVEKKVVFL